EKVPRHDAAPRVRLLRYVALALLVLEPRGRRQRLLRPSRLAAVVLPRRIVRLVPHPTRTRRLRVQDENVLTVNPRLAVGRVDASEGTRHPGGMLTIRG